MKYVLVGLMAYFIGNISTAYILGKLIKKTDIRTMGSGNAGATNALRVYGKKFGALTLLLDLLKGVLACFLASRILGEKGALMAGIAVVLGHDWPVVLGFKGGKGIATSIGVLAFLHWPTALLCLAIGIAIIIKTRYVSLASVGVAALAPFIAALAKRPFDKGFFIVSLILGLLAIYKHRANIVRLKNGEEFKIGEKAK